MSRWAYYILAAATGWTVFFGLSSAQHVLSGAFTWEQAVRISSYEWLPWILISPFILWLTVRYPIGWDHLPSRILVHLAAAALTMVLCAWLSDLLVAPPSPDFGQGPRFHPEDHQPPPLKWTGVRRMTVPRRTFGGWARRHSGFAPASTCRFILRLPV
jgi:MFS superfamily sulfate permease-like transporter